jgi:hypothetical protein
MAYGSDFKNQFSQTQKAAHVQRVARTAGARTPVDWGDAGTPTLTPTGRCWGSFLTPIYGLRADRCVSGCIQINDC